MKLFRWLKSANYFKHSCNGVSNSLQEESGHYCHSAIIRDQNSATKTRNRILCSERDSPLQCTGKCLEVVLNKALKECSGK